MTAGELLRRISSAELTEWMAYFRLEQAEQKAPDSALDRRAARYRVGADPDEDHG